MKLELSETATLINNGSVQQFQQTNEYSQSFEISKSITTTNQVAHSHEVSLSVSGKAEFDLIFSKFGFGISASYKYNWGSSSSQSETEKSARKTTVTVRPQSVIVQPYSKVDVLTEFSSYTDTVYYLVDLNIEKTVELFCPDDVECTAKCTEKSQNRYRYYYLKSFFVELVKPLTLKSNCIHKSSVGNDTTKIECVDDECILRNIPVVIETVGYHTQVHVGDQEAIVG